MADQDSEIGYLGRCFIVLGSSRQCRDDTARVGRAATRELAWLDAWSHGIDMYNYASRYRPSTPRYHIYITLSIAQAKTGTTFSRLCSSTDRELAGGST